jgi:inhibitor of cysteine peptidase
MRSSKWVRVELIVIVLLSVWCVGCPSHKAPVTVTAGQEYDGRTIRLHVGDSVKLSLAENPTTGYKWEFLGKPEPECVIVSDAYVANPAMNQIGGGGAHVWEFRSEKKGTGTVKLGYRRPWEKDKAPAKAFTLTMVVK